MGGKKLLIAELCILIVWRGICGVVGFLLSLGGLIQAFAFFLVTETSDLLKSNVNFLADYSISVHKSTQYVLSVFLLQGPIFRTSEL